jgi:hypothetical protein
MKLLNWIALAPPRRSPGLFPALLALGFLACGPAVARAQSVVTTGAEPAPVAVATGGQGETTTSTTAAAPLAPFQWGPVAFRPHVFYSFSYGDGIQSQPGNQRKTALHTLSPGVLMQIGHRWTVDYTPIFKFYSNDAFSNTLDHDLSITGFASATDLTIQLSDNFSHTSDPLIETGRQTTRTNNSTAVVASYALSRRTRLVTTLSQNLDFVENSPNSYVWGIQTMAHYQFSERVDVGAGLGYGYVMVDPGTDMTYLRPNVRIGWRPTAKLGFDVHAGAEQRTFRQQGAARLNTPTWGGSASYQPFETTSISVTTDRSVTASYFSNQVNENTSWGINLSQRLLEHFRLSGGVTHRKTRYIATSGSLPVGRSDETYSYNARLSTRFLQRGSIAVFYRRTHNDSNLNLFAFTSNQIGCEIGFRY